MPSLQELDSSQIDAAVRGAGERNVPLTICVSNGGSWNNFFSRIVHVRDDRVLIEMPTAEGGGPYEFAPAERIGLTFKLKHHKHICSVTVAGIEQFALDTGVKVPVLSLCWPTRMHRLQRRAYLRVDVPDNRIVRVSFWLGGTQAEPMGGTASAPIWSGTASNLSAGGIQVRCSRESAKVMDVGDIVGLRLLFGLGSTAVYVDGQFRHAEDTGQDALLGFQFLGLGQTRQAQEALKVLSAMVG